MSGEEPPEACPWCGHSPVRSKPLLGIYALRWECPECDRTEYQLREDKKA